MFSCFGSKYISYGYRGPTGPAGPTGIQGPEGPVGLTGPTGETGGQFISSGFRAHRNNPPFTWLGNSNVPNIPNWVIGYTDGQFAPAVGSYSVATTGYYSVQAKIKIDHFKLESGPDSATLILYKTGPIIITSTTSTIPNLLNNSTSTSLTISINETIYLMAGDILYLGVRTNTGYANSIPSIPPPDTSFSIVKIME